MTIIKLHDMTSKTIHFICAALTAASSILLCSCDGKNVERATNTADSFIHSLFQGDFDSASALCCDSLKSKILSLKDLPESSDEAVISRMAAQGESLEWENERVETSDRNDICLKYSTLFLSDPYDITLTLRRVEGDTLWVVTDIR